MTIATRYVDHLYSLYHGRAAVTVGVNNESVSIHPFVFEDINNVPIGLIALSAEGFAHPSDVDIYHISTFNSGKGHGSQIMDFLCDSADEYGVRLCIQAEAQQNGNQTMTSPELVDWYHGYGFNGDSSTGNDLTAHRLLYRMPVISR